jgi:hypothetical protein
MSGEISARIPQIYFYLTGLGFSQIFADFADLIPLLLQYMEGFC